MNILVTLNEAYIPCLEVMLRSLADSTPGQFFSVYLIETSVRDEALDRARRILGENGEIIRVNVADNELIRSLADAPTTSRYPIEIYYRIFAAKLLPETLDRILYLDPDLIVNRSIAGLYSTDMDGYMFAAASHVRRLMQKVNEKRLDMYDSDPYINSGVMLMNLRKLRAEQNVDDVYDFIEEHRRSLVLPDQDIISGLYGEDILPLDPYRYNMTERLFALRLLTSHKMSVDWVRENSAVIHYCGRNKPWRPGYIGMLDVFWNETAAKISGIR